MSSNMQAAISRTKRSSSSGFELLPRELLSKILSQFDNNTILACASLSTSFNSVAVDVLLRRHNIIDPSTSCEVMALVNSTFQPPPADALAALLACARPPERMKHLHCIVRLNHNTKNFPLETLKYPETSPNRLEITGVYALRRLNLLLAKVKSLEKVTINFSGLKYGLIAEEISPLIASVIHNIIQKGCRVLQIKSRRSPFGSAPWAFPITENARKSPAARKLTIARIISAILSFFGFFKKDKRETRRGHRHAHSEASIPLLSTLQPTIHPRITKLGLNGPLFHPTGKSWMSDLFSYSPITDMAISLDSNSSPDFVEHGFELLRHTVPRLQALTLLNVDSQAISAIIPRLRPFVALKNLAICLDSDLSSRPISLSNKSTPFTPSNLQRLSVSPQLIEYMLLGTVTALGLKEFEIIYGRHAQPMIPSICKHVTTVHDFYDKISAPMSIILTISCVTPWTVEDDSESESESSPVRGAGDDSQNVINILEAQHRADLAAVETLQLELLPNGLDGERILNNILKLLSFFPRLKSLHLSGSMDGQGLVVIIIVPKEVRQTIVQPVYSMCSTLVTLRIGDTSYPRPLVNI